MVSLFPNKKHNDLKAATLKTKMTSFPLRQRSRQHVLDRCLLTAFHDSKKAKLKAKRKNTTGKTREFTNPTPSNEFIALFSCTDFWYTRQPHGSNVFDCSSVSVSRYSVSNESNDEAKPCKFHSSQRRFHTCEPRASTASHGAAAESFHR